MFYRFVCIHKRDKMGKRIRLLSVLVLICVEIFSQTNVKVDMMKNSWFAIKGTTNILSFKLLHSGEKLFQKPLLITATIDENKVFLSQNRLVIQVNNFTSDNQMALRDFKKLIKSNEYPTLSVHLNYFEIKPENLKNSISSGNATVNIEITGVSNQYVIPVNSSRKEDLVTVTGSKRINIRDFGLEPPIELLGLIKVNEWITIDFHIICRLTFDKSKSIS